MSKILRKNKLYKWEYLLKSEYKQEKLKQMRLQCRFCKRYVGIIVSDNEFSYTNIGTFRCLCDDCYEQVRDNVYQRKE